MKDLQSQFIEIYETFADPIYRHCFFRVYSEGRAEELMQDTFMKYWLYLEEGNAVQNPRGLLYRIADHLIIDEKRKHTAESLDALVENIGFEPRGADHTETKALLSETMREIAQLRDEEQKLFLMRYMDDLDPKEIAEITGTTANTVSVQLNRIKGKLKKHHDA